MAEDKEPKQEKQEPKQDSKKTGKNGGYTIPVQMAYMVCLPANHWRQDNTVLYNFRL